MRSAADADLVRRDTALPGLATLLDPDALLAALRECLPDVELNGAQIVYLRYKPGTRCLVGYQVDVAGAAVDIHASAYRPDAHDKLSTVRERPGVAGPLGQGRLLLEDRAIVVTAFPNDDDLEALTCLGVDETRERFLRELIPDRPELWVGTVRRLRYKPERRYVAQLLDRDTPRLVLKVYDKFDYDAAQRNPRVFTSRGLLQLPRRLGRSNHSRALAVEWLPGRLLNEALADPTPEVRSVATVGAALAELHAQDPEGLPCLPREREADSLLAVADWVGLVCPPLADRAGKLARRLALLVREQPPMGTPIHGDFYTRQVLLNDGRVGVIDLDHALRSDPASDLGSFIAHLERDGLRGELRPDVVEPVRHALLDGYRTASRRPLPPGIDRCTASGLFGLAPVPFRWREPGWPERIEAIIERAEGYYGRART